MLTAVHTRERNRRCSSCNAINYTFSNNLDLLPLCRFMCGFCDKTFTDRSNMLRHLQTHGAVDEEDAAEMLSASWTPKPYKRFNPRPGRSKKPRGIFARIMVRPPSLCKPCWKFVVSQLRGRA